MVNIASPVLQMKFLIPNEQNSFSSLVLLAAVVLYPWLTIVHFQQKTRSCPTWVWIPPGKGFTLSWGECSSQSALVGKVSSTSMTYRFVVWKSRYQITRCPGLLHHTHTHFRDWRQLRTWAISKQLLNPVPGVACWLPFQRCLIFCTGWKGEVL